MSGILEKNQGIMNLAARYKFTNIMAENFTSHWNGNPIVVKAGQTVTVPQYLANKMTDEMVDKIMIAEIKQKEVDYYKNNPNTAPNFYRAPNNMGVPAARKVWEDQIVQPLPLEEGSTESQLLRMQVQEELTADMNREVSTTPPVVPTGTLDTSGLDSGRSSLAGNITNEEEFADIKPKRKN